MEWVISKSRAVVWLGVVLMGITAIAPATEQQQSPAQAEIKQLEQKWLQNEDRPEALESILADDFVHVLPAGMVSKREQIDFLRAHPRPNSGTKSFESLKVRIYGTVAIANGVVRATRAAGPPVRTAFTDVFLRRNGLWQAVNAQELPLNSEAHNPE
jgi:hypothetical protein